MEQQELQNLELELGERIRGDVSVDEVTRGIYATDASIYQITPLAVVLPRDEQDVRAVVEIAADKGISILPRGGGTSLGAKQRATPSCWISQNI